MFSRLRTLFGGSGKTAATHRPAELRTLLAADAPPLVVDVRERSEFGGGHIPGALNIPLGQVAARAAELAAHDRPVVVVCLSDMRSRRAAAQLQHAGLQDLAILHGGTAAWVREGYPIQAGS
jgi:rhodanese-related sulfurtransferase